MIDILAISNIEIQYSTQSHQKFPMHQWLHLTRYLH
jgi:hypothetical protein